MNNLILDPSEEELEEAMSLSPAPQPFVSDLRQKVLGQPTKRPAPRFRRLFKWAPVMIGILLAIVIFAVGPEKVVYAMRQWLGLYFPGIGFVDHTSLRILEKPVRVSLVGVDAEIKRTYTNEQHLVIGIADTNDSRPCREWKVYSHENHALFYRLSLVRVFLPDGQEITVTPNGDYPPLPPDVNRIVVRVPTFKDTPGCPSDHSCRCIDADQFVDLPLTLVAPQPREGLEIYDLQFTPLPSLPKNTP
jgi:hypothetical protein